MRLKKQGLKLVDHTEQLGSFLKKKKKKKKRVKIQKWSRPTEEHKSFQSAEKHLHGEDWMSATIMSLTSEDSAHDANL